MNVLNTKSKSGAIHERKGETLYAVCGVFLMRTEDGQTFEPWPETEKPVTCIACLGWKHVRVTMQSSPPIEF